MWFDNGNMGVFFVDINRSHVGVSKLGWSSVIEDSDELPSYNISSGTLLFAKVNTFYLWVSSIHVANDLYHCVDGQLSG